MCRLRYGFSLRSTADLDTRSTSLPNISFSAGLCHGFRPMAGPIRATSGRLFGHSSSGAGSCSEHGPCTSAYSQSPPLIKPRSKACSSAKNQLSVSTGAFRISTSHLYSIQFLAGVASPTRSLLRDQDTLLSSRCSTISLSGSRKMPT